MAKVAPRNEMPRQDPKVRAHNFNEVALGYSLELAVAEAARCLQCKKPTCIDGCPVQVRIPEFILALRDGDMWGAVEALKDKNSLPAICGRVCPHESSNQWPLAAWRGLWPTGRLPKASRHRRGLPARASVWRSLELARRDSRALVTWPRWAIR